MNSLSIKILNLVCASFLLLIWGLPVKAQSSGNLQWGEAVDGVQMAISEAGTVKPGVPNLRVTFKNNRQEDVDLYLGIIGGSGTRPCVLENRTIPCTFNFTLGVTDAAGKTRRFKFKGIMYVAGRLDPYIAWLRAGATYALDIGLDQFWSPETKEFELKLADGENRIFLEFEGRKPDLMSHEQAINKMNFWKGTLKSNTLAIELR
jgi:hypothetical protein